jgi:DNA-binding transcriptional ArsR family regulator
MDQQKDNQRHIGQDQKGHSYGPQFTNVRNKEPMTLSYVSKKLEKLTTALYMVTDIMNDQEPMKWKLRESGVELLSDIMLATGASQNERMNLLRLVEKKIEKVISFLDVAGTARMMSEMNATILKKEYVAIKDTIQNELVRPASLGGAVLHESFFNVPHELPSKTPALSPEGDSSPRNVHVRDQREETQKDIRSAAQSEQVKYFPPTVSTEKKDIITPTSLMSDKPLSQPEKESRTESAPPPAVAHAAPHLRIERPTLMEARPGTTRADANTVARDDRRKIILALIKQKPSLTVKDIAKSISGYSEKTIQRELLAMVAEGILAKKGERRWSAYSLAQ